MSKEPDERDDVTIDPGGWVDRVIATERRDFPVKETIDEPLRVSISRRAHDAILNHAKEELDRELCGVLLGKVCEDSQGIWVSADVALRGETEKQGGTHVTYTHETWEKIYAVKEREYPDLMILGWYHTHPGFGVQFSEMDLFIQQNFFPGEAQFALVVDPTSGQQAIIANTVGGTEYVSQFWVDGKSQKAEIPRGQASRSNRSETVSESMSVALDDRLRSVEERLAQVLQSNETQRESQGRLFLLFGFLCSVLLAGSIGYWILDRTWVKRSPPEDLQMVNVPIRVNGKVMMVGMQVRGWEVPDGENLLAEAEQRALQRAVWIMQNPDSSEAQSLAVSNRPTLSPTLTLIWAILASVIALALGVMRFLRKRSPQLRGTR